MISRALQLNVFDQPVKYYFFNNLLVPKKINNKYITFCRISNEKIKTAARASGSNRGVINRFLYQYHPYKNFTYKNFIDNLHGAYYKKHI